MSTSIGFLGREGLQVSMVQGHARTQTPCAAMARSHDSGIQSGGAETAQGSEGKVRRPPPASAAAAAGRIGPKLYKLAELRWSGL